MAEPVPSGKEMPIALEVDAVLHELWQDLPAIARDLIKDNLLPDPTHQAYWDNPDDPGQHAPNWHQWGVISHSKAFDIAYQREIPELLQYWEIGDLTAQALAPTIDGTPKSQLIRLSAPLHDLGKFARRQVNKDAHGNFLSASYPGHEAASGEVVRSSQMIEKLTALGLTHGQVDYLAACSELHFKLGTLRDDAKQAENGWSIAYINSSDFDQAAGALMRQYPHMQLEMGLLFLADNLAKTEYRLGADTDQQIAEQSSIIEQSLAQNGLDVRLAASVMQTPVNVAAAKRYLELWATQSQQSGKNWGEL